MVRHGVLASYRVGEQTFGFRLVYYCRQHRFILTSRLQFCLKGDVFSTCSIISMLYLFAQHHSRTPYFQIGFIIIAYSRRLRAIVYSECGPTNQKSLRIFSLFCVFFRRTLCLNASQGAFRCILLNPVVGFRFDSVWFVYFLGFL